MRIGVPKEIKDRECRVGLTPPGVQTLVGDGHDVFVEAGAGAGSGFDDDGYRDAGATIVGPDAAWDVDLVAKIKEPLAAEYPLLCGQIVFTYFHLAGVDRALTERLLETRTSAIAYETVESADGRLPLLAPMSAVAGNIAVTMGAYYLARFNGGRGMLLGRVLGREFGKVLVIGDGIVGRHAAAAALGMGAAVSITSRHAEREASLREALSPRLSFCLSTPDTLAREIRDTDLVIGGVLTPGAKAPRVVTTAMVRSMMPGSVIVDVSIDQGGCIETSRPTSHTSPVFSEYDVIHYCVTNMPGAYPRTSTIALTDATLPYARRLAAHGLGALAADPGFAKGLNTHAGAITCKPAAEALGLMVHYREIEPAEFSDASPD